MHEEFIVVQPLLPIMFCPELGKGPESISHDTPSAQSVRITSLVGIHAAGLALLRKTKCLASTCANTRSEHQVLSKVYSNTALSAQPVKIPSRRSSGWPCASE